jgi:hypothetical protein
MRNEREAKKQTRKRRKYINTNDYIQIQMEEGGNVSAAAITALHILFLMCSAFLPFRLRCNNQL